MPAFAPVLKLEPLSCASVGDGTILVVVEEEDEELKRLATERTELELELRLDVLVVLELLDDVELLAANCEKILIICVG